MEPVVLRWAVNNINRRSVLPGSGNGMTEESKMATPKRPNPPKLTNHRSRGERCEEAACRVATFITLDADCNHKIIR